MGGLRREKNNIRKTATRELKRMILFYASAKKTFFTTECTQSEQIFLLSCLRSVCSRTNLTDSITKLKTSYPPDPAGGGGAVSKLFLSRFGQKEGEGHHQSSREKGHFQEGGFGRTVGRGGNDIRGWGGVPPCKTSLCGECGRSGTRGGRPSPRRCPSMGPPTWRGRE